MTDETRERADELIPEEDEALYGAIERDARRYNKAFGEEEEAVGR